MSAQPMKTGRSAGKPRKIRSFEAWYARLNLRRGRVRTVITILSLVMSITVFVALQSFTSLLDASAAIKDSHTGDYSVTNETAGISEEAVNSLRRQDFVESLATTKMTICHSLEELPFDTDLEVQSHETLQIVSLDEDRFFSSVSGLTEQDQTDLRAGTACLVKNPIEFAIGDAEVEYTSVKAGDVLTFNEKMLGSKDARRIVSCFASSLRFGRCWTSATGAQHPTILPKIRKSWGPCPTFSSSLGGP